MNLEKFFILTFSFLGLGVFDYYLKTNVKEIDGSHSLLFLLAFIGFGFIFIIVLIFLSRQIKVSLYVLILLLYFAYISVRVIIDWGEPDILKAYLIGTKGSMILYFVLGSIVGIISNEIESKSNFGLIFLIYLFFSTFLLADIFYKFSQNLRLDYFLFKDAHGKYQRPGDFIIMGFLIVLNLYTKYIANQREKNNRIISVTGFIIFVLLFIYAFLCLVVTQMLGSNKGAAMILGLSIVWVSIGSMLFSYPIV